MLSNPPADPTNVPPSPLTFETSSMPRSGGEAEAMLRARVEQYYDRQPGAGRLDGDQSAGRLYGLSFCTFYLAAHSHQQRAGEPKPSDSPAYPGRRYPFQTPSPHYDSSPLSSRRFNEDWLIGKQYLSLVDFKPQENPISDHSQSNYRKTVA